MAYLSTGIVILTTSSVRNTLMLLSNVKIVTTVMLRIPQAVLSEESLASPAIFAVFVVRPHFL